MLTSYHIIDILCLLWWKFLILIRISSNWMKPEVISFERWPSSSRSELRHICALTKDAPIMQKRRSRYIFFMFLSCGITQLWKRSRMKDTTAAKVCWDVSEVSICRHYIPLVCSTKISTVRCLEYNSVNDVRYSRVFTPPGCVTLTCPWH